MEQVKALALPAALAVVGVRASAMFGVKGQIGQIVASVIGAGAGIWLSKKFS